MRRTSLVLSVLVVALLAGGMVWWTKNKPAAPVARTAGGAQSVGVFTALKQDVPVTLEASGTVTALNTVELRAQTTSTIKDVLIKDGASVKRGDLLFRFDDRADRANVEKARAQLARDRATVADLTRQYQRAQELRAQNFVAQNAVDTALANLDGQRALIQSDEAALQAAQVALSYNDIRAPMSGRAGVVNVVVGSLVQASGTALPLVTLAQINPITVSFTLPESQLGTLLQATRAVGKDIGKDGASTGSKQAPLTAEVLMPGSTEAAPKGHIYFVDNLVDSASGTIKVKAEFDNSRQLLWPGQYVRVRMTLRSIKDAVVIPQAALIQRGNERSVYIVGADNTAQLKPVRLIHSFGEMVVVERINAGDAVVLDGKQNLRPGGKVVAQAAAVNPAASSAAPSTVETPASGASR